MQNVTKNMITKTSQDTQSTTTHQNLGTLLQSIQSLSSKNFGMIKSDLDKYKQEVKDLEVIMREQTQRVQGNILLDMNLERGRMKDEIKDVEQHLDLVKKSVDEEITKLDERVQKIQFDLRQTVTQLIFASFIFFIGYKIFLFNLQNSHDGNPLAADVKELWDVLFVYINAFIIRWLGVISNWFD